MDLQKLAEAKREYINGRGSIREIAFRIGLPEKTLQQYAFNHDWTGDREANLALKPIGDFQTALAVWRCKGLDLLEKVEEKIQVAIQDLKPGNSKGVMDCARAATLVIDCWREVAGIPRMAPLKTDEKKEKQIPVETAPIESQATDTQSDAQ